MLVAFDAGISTVAGIRLRERITAMTHSLQPMNLALSPLFWGLGDRRTAVMWQSATPILGFHIPPALLNSA
jgi:hypothetical protein